MKRTLAPAQVGSPIKQNCHDHLSSISEELNMDFGCGFLRRAACPCGRTTSRLNNTLDNGVRYSASW
jgi:hypothetical protein